MKLFKTFNIFSQTTLQQDNGNQYALIPKCQSQATTPFLKKRKKSMLTWGDEK